MVVVVGWRVWWQGVEAGGKKVERVGMGVGEGCSFRVVKCGSRAVESGGLAMQCSGMG